MKYLSVCSGIEAATCAWHSLGWTPFAFSEIESFPCAVLSHHYPNVPNFGDMTKFKEWPDATIDLLVGGTPCQSFSVAGLRKGLDDPRGNLMLTYGAIAAKYRPQWLVWENVPGVLSSNGGRDFGAFLGLLAELGYGFAYRVLDAQYVRVESHPRAVPQRRRRVFVVGHSGGQWQRAAAVLFERESLCGHPAPRREAGKVAPTIPARSLGGGGLGTDFDLDGGVIESFAIQAGALRTNPNSGPDGVGVQADLVYTLEARAEVQAVAVVLRGREGFDASEDGTGRGTPLVPVAYGIDYEHNAHSLNDATGPLLKGSSSGGGHPLPAIAVSLRGREGGATAELGDEVQNCLRASGGGGDKAHVLTAMQVRRLTPRECERLQGFQDDYTLINVRGKSAADGPRYKALGNSMAVPCMSWIGKRIAEVEAITAERVAA